MIILGDKAPASSPPWDPGAVLADISATDGTLAACAVDLEASRRYAEGSVIAKLAAAINHDGGISSSPRLHDGLAHSGPARRPAATLTGASPGTTPCRRAEGGYGLAPAVPRGSRNASLALRPRSSTTRVEMRPSRKGRRPEGRGRALWEIFRPSGCCASSAAPARQASRASTPGAELKRSGQARWQGTSKPSPRTAGAIPAAPSSSKQRRHPSASLRRRRHRALPRRARRPAAPSSSTPTAARRPRSCPRTTRPLRHDRSPPVQGSEFPGVAVFPADRPRLGLATRELLYTGVTRTSAPSISLAQAGPRFRRESHRSISGTRRRLPRAHEGRPRLTFPHSSQNLEASPRVRIGAGRGHTAIV